MSDQRFAALEHEIVETTLRQSPIAATMAGRHDYDMEMDDLSLPALDAAVRTYRDLLARLGAIDAAALPHARQIDHALLRSHLESAAFWIDDLHIHRSDPSRYVEWGIYALYFLMLRDAPPLEDRVRAMAARFTALPRFLETGRANLDLSLTPALFAEVAAQIADGGAEFVHDVLTYVRDRDARLVAQLEGPAAGAVEAFRRYSTAMRDDVSPRARGHFAVGRDKLDWLFRRHHLLPMDSRAIASRGRATFDELLRLMGETARLIDPGAPSWREVIERAKEDVPEPSQILALYRDDVAALRRFIVERGLAPIPEGEVCEVVETPAFERSVTPYAAYQAPGPFERTMLGYFYATPVDLTAPPQVQHEQLQGHCRASRVLTALHEAYPGHHLQLMHGIRVTSLARKLADSSVLAEGWALYCEEMMYEEGYYTEAITRLWQLKDALWRAGRIIVDVGLHTGEMTFDQAVDFMVDEVMLERPNAVAEVKRYCMNPTQPSSYMLGKLAILDMRAEAKKQQGAAFRLGDFHARLLEAGTLPVPLVRAHVLGEEVVVPA